jgi:hypothetical protein
MWLMVREATPVLASEKVIDRVCPTGTMPKSTVACAGSGDVTPAEGWT